MELRYGDLTVLGPAPHLITVGGNKVRRVQVRCICGLEWSIKAVHLLSGHSRSCGKDRVEHKFLRLSAEECRPYQEAAD